ncbi:hypothetical protein, partial [Haematobacter missouriensis]|uniref:hypothetical protein n=1 Tax=Haematobacter missouriensis TaxID=366616 RepID=UPI001B8065F7
KPESTLPAHDPAPPSIGVEGTVPHADLVQQPANRLPEKSCHALCAGSGKSARKRPEVYGDFRLDSSDSERFPLQHGPKALLSSLLNCW